MLNNLIGIAVLAGLAVVIYLQFTRRGTTDSVQDQERAKILVEENAQLKAAIEQSTQEVGRLQNSIAEQESQKNEWKGKYAELFTADTNLKADLKALLQENDSLKKQVGTYKEQETRKDKEFDAKMRDLAKSEQSFQEERQRLIQAEQMEHARLEAERDRIWADHEHSVISAMTTLCKQPQYAFSYYNNTSLPDGFDGSLKPDFMIEFLDQYIIFDAKASKAESLQTYITNAVKTTIQKVKKNTKIAPMVFLVVPTEAINELKNHIYAQDGYTIYVISPESLGPILHSLKKITTYELAEKLDPQKRENIINLIAELDFHVNLRNAADLFFTKAGINIIEKAQKIDPEIAADVQLKKQEMKVPAFTELKKLVLNTSSQNEELGAIVSPKASVRAKDIETVKQAVVDRLM